MKIFKRFIKARHLRIIAKNFLSHLQNRYGASSYYTYNQITKTLHECGFDNSLVQYPMAMYLTNEDFEQLMNELKLTYDYEILRKEIAAKYFKGESYQKAPDNFFTLPRFHSEDWPPNGGASGPPGIIPDA
ncbi:MAG: hypothetical protein CME64_03050 [Halobacteriovoraceae bacterium]|nr:hypothetical protein [Halobacteriovoraceae bacterium]|tara:strand:+ start:272 stop:664 length:393 start_codon:yes stop_codon:yes gene_type:complete